MKKFAFAALVTACLTVAHERIGAAYPTYCTLTCQDCWLIWTPADQKFYYGAEFACGGGQINECKYGIRVTIFDNANPETVWWSTGTNQWMNCNTLLDLTGSVGAPPGMIAGHVYTAYIHVSNAYLGYGLCDDSVVFVY